MLKKIMKNRAPLITNLILFVILILCIYYGQINVVKNRVIESLLLNAYTAISVYFFLSLVQFLASTYGVASKLTYVDRSLKEIKEANCPKCIDYSYKCLSQVPWGLAQISNNRRTFTGDDAKFIIKARRNLDIIACGLSDARRFHQENEVIAHLNESKLNIRIICPDPGKYTAKSQEKFENYFNDISSIDFDRTVRTIRELQHWVETIQAGLKDKDRILLKTYDTLPLFFYMRIDDMLYVGPYIIGKSSSDSITFCFSKGGDGFYYFEKIFSDTWEKL